MNERYIKTLVSLIQKGIVNLKTMQPFTINDILSADYRSVVEAILNP